MDKEKLAAYRKLYSETHKEQKKERDKKYKEKHKIANRIWYASHKEHKMEWQRNNRMVNKISYQESYRKRTLLEKIDALKHYSKGQCVCIRCGYSDVRALSIDHINGGGVKHRRSSMGVHTYHWLKKNNYPEGYQVLCMNCQFIKRIANRECDKDKQNDGMSKMIEYRKDQGTLF